ncbi:transcriptional regulator [Micromonospora sp. CPCC 206171]|uniref:AfsR/SARP family transcriptional regulator n=1 Tax=Micromonospora sp. CPCC 206171 TaxID=3122405 RepID=UPI002FF08785
MQLEIRLLGAVELFVDGQVVTPGSGKRRAVLAGLALEPNRPVSLQRLAEMAWSDSPPASAVANLRSHAAELRRTLGDRLIARLNAYELRMAPHELDASEFQRLAGEGRRLLATQEAASAIPALTDALAYWRGPAGGGIPRGTALDNRWASLDEQRLQVFEELTEARLAAGRHSDVLAGLRQHLAAHPLRERAWEHLMLALYRCGDLPAALAAYQDARAALSEQLGVEPGGELADLHRQMLERAPQLSRTLPRTEVTMAVAAPPRPSGTIAWAVPRELPPDLAAFVVRTEETAAVVETVTVATPAAAVITGPPGSGKTATAVRAAHMVGRDFPDGQVFIDLGYRVGATSEEVLARALRALGVAPSDVPDGTDERVGWWRSLVAGRRLLLVMDGVTRSAQVRPLLPAGPGPALIVVGQRQLGGLDGVRRVGLAPLTAAGARGLLATLAGGERLAADPHATKDLVRLCAGSVLALRIAGSRLARWPQMPVAALVDQLGDGRDRLDLLACEDLSVRASLAKGVAAICGDSEVANQLFKRLAESPDTPALVDALARQLGVSTVQVRRAVDDLIDAHLVHRDGAGRYRLPALVRDYAAELAAAPSGPVSLLHRNNDPFRLRPESA